MPLAPLAKAAGWTAAAALALLAAHALAGTRVRARASGGRAADGRRPRASTTARTNSTALPPQRFDILDPDTKNETILLLKRLLSTAAALGPARPRRAARRRLRVAERADDPRLRSHARLQSAAHRRGLRRDRRARLHRGSGPARVQPAVSVLSLAARRHARPALHRVERADRTRSTAISRPAICASSRARPRAMSTRTHARCRASCSPPTGWRRISTG